jgi:tetratricopeptide (TPR) repeat protein
MNNSNHTDRIEAYLMNNMTSEERDNFEKQITNDKALAEEIRLYTLESAALRLLEQKELRGKFEVWKIEKQQPQQKEATVRRLKTTNYIGILSIAASFLFLMVVGARWANVNYSSQAIADSLFLDTTARGDANNSNNPFSEVAAAIAAKDYSQAITLLDNFEGTDLSEKAALMKAEVYYKKGDYNNAETTYRRIIDNPNGQEVFLNDAKIYLAAVYLKQGKEQQAMTILNTLASSNNNRQEEAKKLLNKYNSFWHRFTW